MTVGQAALREVMRAPSGSDPPREVEDIVGLFARLAMAQATPDERRRRLLALGVCGMTARAIPGIDPPPRPARAGRGAGARVEPAEVRAAEAMSGLFHAGDAAFGGGHGRRALSAYLAADLAPRLGRPASPEVRRRLVAVTGELAYQCAFMCFDDELHGTAQSYYRAALRLAAENDDDASYAIALRGLSVQAHALGHHRHALVLAEGAVGHGPRGQEMTRAFVYAQLAVARAADGAAHDALAALSVAEASLERISSPGHGLSGAFHPAALLLAQAEVRALLGDPAGAVVALEGSVECRPPAERRSRALVLARLAQLHLRCGDLDQAVGTWHRFLDEYRDLRCARADRALQDLRTRIRPLAGNPGARRLLHRATDLGVGIRD